MLRILVALLKFVATVLAFWGWLIGRSRYLVDICEAPSRTRVSGSETYFIASRLGFPLFAK